MIKKLERRSLAPSFVIFGLIGSTFSLVSSSQVSAMGYASLTCKELHEHMDRIYFDNGFCMPDSDAAAQGDKSRCTVRQLSDVSFSQSDMQNLMLIARNEEKKDCPYKSVAPMADPSK